MIEQARSNSPARCLGIEWLFDSGVPSTRSSFSLSVAKMPLYSGGDPCRVSPLLPINGSTMPRASLEIIVLVCSVQTEARQACKRWRITSADDEALADAFGVQTV